MLCRPCGLIVLAALAILAAPLAAVAQPPTNVHRIGRLVSCQVFAQNTHPHTPVKKRGKALLERGCEWVKG
jgi:hypothetical protein